LSDEERKRLEALLAKSEELRAEADEFRALDRLIKRWGAQPVELDWEPHGAVVDARIDAEDEEEDLGRIDEWLQRWGDRGFEIDEERFTAGVMARIGASRRSPMRSLIFRIGTPLAAAAAIAVALTATFWSPRPSDPMCDVVIGPKVGTTGDSTEVTAPAAVVVSFRRLPEASRVEPVATSGISTVWAAPGGSQSFQGAPL
jgi:hypothetical protein